MLTTKKNAKRKLNSFEERRGKLSLRSRELRKSEKRGRNKNLLTVTSGKFARLRVNFVRRRGKLN